MSSLGDKKGRSANSSDLTKMRREAVALGALSSYSTDIKKTAAQSHTTAGILTLKTSAVTAVEAATTGVTTNPIANTVIAATTVKVVKKV